MALCSANADASTTMGGVATARARCQRGSTEGIDIDILVAVRGVSPTYQQAMALKRVLLQAPFLSGIAPTWRFLRCACAELSPCWPSPDTPSGSMQPLIEITAAEQIDDEIAAAFEILLPQLRA